MNHARASCALSLCFLAAVASAHAQTRWTVDPTVSLAWWQVNPHLNHLWATTCPQEPSWRPGEGRGAGWVIGETRRPKQGYAGVYDTTVVPLYPRLTVRAVCAEAVEGEILVADTVAWRGVRGEVVVKAAALISGEERRDEFAHESVLEASRYPDIRFTIDSVVGLTPVDDTLRGRAMGVFTMHGVSKPMTASVRAWRDAGGLRVLARFRVPAAALTDEYGISKVALGLGVTTRIWYHLYMGVDVVLRPAS